MDNQSLGGIELVLAWLCIGLIMSFVIYAFFYKPHVVKRQIEILINEEEKRRKNMSSAEREKEDEEQRLKNLQKILELKKLKIEQDNSLKETLYGSINKTLLCPHCQSKGHARKKQLTRIIKTRVNSIPAKVIGLGTNTENKVTAMRCDKCETEWDVT